MDGADQSDVHGCQYTETIRQDYANMQFSGGIESGQPVHTLFIEIERMGPPGEIGYLCYLFRPDEMAALAWIAAGVLWGLHMQELMEIPTP
jgi:hypothetical protein